MTKNLKAFRKQVEKMFPGGSWEKDLNKQILFYTNQKNKGVVIDLCNKFLPEGQVELDNEGNVLIYTNNK